MIKLRILGTAKEICVFCDKLKQKDFVILSSSKFYEDREQGFVETQNKTGRIYIEVD